MAKTSWEVPNAGAEDNAQWVKVQAGELEFRSPVSA